MYSGLGISLTNYISPSFDIGLQGNYGNYGYYETMNFHFRGLKFDTSLITRYKFDNGYILSNETKFSPFISLGVGLATYSINPATDRSEIDHSLNPTIITTGIDFIIPLGFGLSYRLTNSISLQYQYLYTITNSDVHDQNISAGVDDRIFGTPAHPNSIQGSDDFGQHLIGLVFLFDETKSTKFCRCIYN